MSTRHLPFAISSLALMLAFAFLQGATAWGQTLGTSPGAGRTVNERLTTETSPPINADPSLPVPAANAGATNSVSLDTAILIEHAVDMAIESSSMMAIVGPASANAAELDSVKSLRNKARKLMSESQGLLGQAAADGRSMAAHPAVSRFHSAANLYVTTLSGMDSVGPAETAQMIMINQALKDVLDADHIQQMSRMNVASVPLQQLKTHASKMKTEGNDLIRRMTANASADPSISVNVATLATRARQLLDSADELGRIVASSRVQGHPTTGPGRFQFNRPEIIGGTYGTGSARVGVYQGLDHPYGATEPKAMDEPSTIPTYSNQTTGSTGGLKPR